MGANEDAWTVEERHMTGTKNGVAKPRTAAVLARLRRLLPRLEERFGVSRLDVFGSYVHGTARKGSDLDLLVEFDRPIDLLDLVATENFISDELGVRVDLVMRSSLKPRIRDRVLAEAMPV